MTLQTTRVRTCLEGITEDTDLTVIINPRICLRNLHKKFETNSREIIIPELIWIMGWCSRKWNTNNWIIFRYHCDFLILNTIIISIQKKFYCRAVKITNCGRFLGLVWKAQFYYRWQQQSGKCISVSVLAYFLDVFRTCSIKIVESHFSARYHALSLLKIYELRS